METTAKKPNQNREILKQISAPFKVQKAAGAIASINEGLKNYYRAQGHEVLKTLHQWNAEGKRVASGSKALLMWGSPKHIKPKANPEADEMEFYPICYLFSNLQVYEKQ